MPRRSTIITVSNNTDRDLILTQAECWHGDWTNDIPPPSAIPRKTCGSWEAESASVGRGTEGVVAYQISNPEPGKAPDEPYIISSPLLVQCRPEQAVISWQNPFIWDDLTKPIHTLVVTTDEGTNPPGCAHELFGVSSQVNDNAKIT